MLYVLADPFADLFGMTPSTNLFAPVSPDPFFGLFGGDETCESNQIKS